MTDNRLIKTDNPFPDGSRVRVRYPTAEQEAGQAPRECWAWMDGWVEQRCGPDEWLIIVTDPDADEIGPDGETSSPWCFRDHSEIALRPEALA